MRKRVALGLALLDATCIVAGISSAWAFWLWLAPNLQHLVQIRLWELFLPNPWMPAGAALVLGWVAVLGQLGLYDPGRMENSVRIARATTKAGVYLAIGTVAANVLLSERIYPKGLIVPLLGLSWAYVLFARLLVFRVLLRLEAPPTAANALIVGIGPDAAAMAERMEREARLVCRVAGHLRTAMSGPPAIPEDRVLGTLEELPALVNRHDIRVVILATRTLPREGAMQLAVQADRMGLRVLQAPYSWGVVSPRLGFARVGGLDLIDLVGIQYPTLGEQLKRGFDWMAVLLGGLALSPLLVAVALAIKLSDGGPVLYTSRRIGRGGRAFNFYKFRSMVVGADRAKDNLRALNESDGRLFKMRNDPRVTRIGRLLRATSIDELPQLLNVLRGDMNLVGPRPLPEGDLAGIEHDPEMRYWFEQRSKVKPGITGMWQVAGRSSLGFNEMVRLDIHYIQNWSFWLDVQILLKTVPAVLRGRGAH